MEPYQQTQTLSPVLITAVKVRALKKNGRSSARFFAPVRRRTKNPGCPLPAIDKSYKISDWPLRPFSLDLYINKAVD